MVDAFVPLSDARILYLVPGVPLMVTPENSQSPFPFADDVVFPVSDAPPREPLSNSGNNASTHVPDAVDAH